MGDTVPNVAGLTHGHQQRREVHMRSHDKGLPQRSAGSDNVSDSCYRGMPRQGVATFHDFMSIYTSLTNMATGTGAESAKGSTKIAKQRLHKSKRECMAAGWRDLPQKGCASHPQSSNKKMASRLKKATSPIKGNSKSKHCTY